MIVVDSDTGHVICTLQGEVRLFREVHGRAPRVDDLSSEQRVELGKLVFGALDYRDEKRRATPDDVIYVLLLEELGIERSRPDGVDAAQWFATYRHWRREQYPGEDWWQWYPA